MRYTVTFSLLALVGFCAGLTYAAQGCAWLCFGFLAGALLAVFLLGYIEGRRDEAAALGGGVE